MKTFFCGLLLALLSGYPLFAQTFVSESQSGFAPASPSPSLEGKKPAVAAPQGPTIIDSQAMDYDEKTRIAIFTGDDYGVYVQDPQFKIYCDKLTAFMRKGAGSAPLKGAPVPKPSPGDKADAATQKASGLQRAIAEGNADQPVVIVQDKPAANGEQPQHNVGIAQKADYNSDTGDIILSGWPRMSQGINTQIATSGTTVMIMNKFAHTTRAIGPTRTVIQDQPKETGTNSAAAADQTPASPPQ